MSRLRSGGSAPVEAFSANTAVRARTRPPAAVRIAIPAGSLRTAVARVPSKIRAPRASSRSRSPKASRAGWTVAVWGTNTPPRNTGEAQIARAPASSSACTVLPSTASALTPCCAGAVEARARPPCDPGVDALGLAPRADHVDGRVRGVHPRAGGRFAEVGAQRRQAEVEAGDEAAVAAARAVPAARRLEDHDPRSGSAASRCHAVHMPV